MLRITLKKSPIGHEETQKRTVKALGLGKLNSSTTKPDTPQIRGMVRKVAHLVEVEEIQGTKPGGKDSETE